MKLFYIESDDMLDEFISAFVSAKDKYISLDTETTSLDVLTADLLLLQLEFDNKVFVFNARKVTKIGEVLDLIIFTDRTCIAHNAKYDAKVLRATTGREIKKWYDTMYIEALLNAGIGKKFYSLSELVEKYTNTTLNKEIRSNFFERMDGEFTQEEINYAVEDVLYLKKIKKAQLEAAAIAGETYIVTLESKLLPAVASMEFNGITLNVNAWMNLLENNKALAATRKDALLKKLINTLDFDKFDSAYTAFTFLKIGVKTKGKQRELSQIRIPSLIENAVLCEFNINSTNQMKVLFSGIFNRKLESTAKKTLVALKGKVSKIKYSFVEDLLSYREINKRVTTYGQKILARIHPKTNKIHAEFHNIGTATGRFSSSKPNMQNIPREAAYRNAFIASKDYKIIGIDYSQQEYRLVGALSGDKVIIDSYIAGLDMHTATAAVQFDKTPSEVTPAERSYGKTINFAIIYGTTSFGLKKNLEIPLEKAERIIDMFYAGYPTLYSFKTQVENKILELGFSVTASGRRRYMKEIPTFCTPGELRNFKGRLKREGFNHIIQGTAADITKLAMINIYEKNPFGDKLRLLLQVHDEIICEAHESIVDAAYVFVQKEMVDAEQAFLGDIPAIADGYIKDFWEKA